MSALDILKATIDSAINNNKPVNGIDPATVAGRMKAIADFAATNSSIPDGGTAGQVLSKIDDADYNVEWIDSQQEVSFVNLTGEPYDNNALATELNKKADLPDELISGGVTAVNANDVTISAASWRISGVIHSIEAPSLFNDIINSTLGNQRYVVFYGNNTNEIVKVEGVESNLAVMPTQSSDTAVISYVLVGDSGIGQPEIDLTGYALRVDLGDKSNLLTEDKSNAVSAINELTSAVNSLDSDQITLKIFKVSNYATN